MSAHGHFGDSASTGTFMFGVIGDGIFGSTVGAFLVPFVAYNGINRYLCRYSQ